MPGEVGAAIERLARAAERAAETLETLLEDENTRS
jgi:hypothetical protein